VAGEPHCRAINDKILSLARELRPEIVLLHSTWDRYPEGVAETVAALKKETSARAVVLDSAPWWKRGLPNEMLRYFIAASSPDPGALQPRGIGWLRRDVARSC